MIKVLLVDDERLIIQGFLHSVDWKSYGYDIIGTAESAKEALRICETVIPDIAILDINMSGMDGLELGVELKKLNPDVVIILLTAYSDFSYAREAVRKQFDEYLLKPEIEFENILESMERFSPKIISSTKIKMEKEGTEIWKLLQNELKNDSEVKVSDKLTEKIKRYIQKPYVCYYICIESFHINERLFDNVNKKAFDIISDYIDYNGIIFQPFMNSYVLITEIKHDAEPVQFAENIISLFDEVNITVTIGVSKSFNEAADIGLAFSQAKSALLRKFYKNEQILMYHENQDTKKVNVKEYIESAEQLLSIDDLNGFHTSTSRLLEGLSIMQASRGSATSALVQTLLMLMKKIESKGTDIYELIGKHEADIFEEVQQCNSFEEMEEWFRNIYNKLMEIMLANDKNTKNNLIDEVLKYIEENYEDPELTLDKTAKHFYISYAYLSYLFSREMSESFSHYLMNMRMKKAKQLIIADKLKLADVALKCGYNNTSYFIKVFKRVMGMTPYKYRTSFLDGKNP